MPQTARHDANRTANLLATFALFVTDAQSDAIDEGAGLSPIEAAALVTINHEPGASIDFVRQVLRRSHSATVRLVASLERAGLVARGPADDARAVSLHLSPEGRRAVAAFLQARARRARAPLAVLTERERSQLTRILEKLLTASTGDELHAYQVCRLCDESACPEDECPVVLKFT